MAMLCMPLFANAQVLLFQDFNSSTVVADYVGTGQHQFDYIGTGGTSSVYITNSRIQLQRNNTAAAIVKKNIAATSPSLLRIQFKLNSPFGGVLANPAIVYVGSGLVASNNVTGEVATAPGNRHSSFGIGFNATIPNPCGTGNTNEFYLRSNSTTPVVNSGNFSCEQTINWFINNSGSGITYANPAGGSSTLVDDAADIWVGNTRVFAAIPAIDPNQTLDDFKIFYNNGSGAISFDDILFMTGVNALPVAISTLKAAMAGAANQINWSTASEFNNKGFYIERQTKTGTWESIGFVAGSNKAATYTFKDEKPLQVSNYRLRQVDLDGKETFSSVVTVTQKFRDRISIAPNPASNVVTIDLTQLKVSNNFATAVLYDLTGRKVMTQNSKTGTIQLDLTNVPKGNYVLNVLCDGNNFNEKIVKL